MVQWSSAALNVRLRNGGTQRIVVAPSNLGGMTDGEGTVGTAEGTVRVDSWIWSVRLTKTRSQAATACRGGHVRVNGERVKPAHALKAGDEVRLFHAGRERVVVVARIIRKR